MAERLDRLRKHRTFDVHDRLAAGFLRSGLLCKLGMENIVACVGVGQSNPATVTCWQADRRQGVGKGDPVGMSELRVYDFGLQLEYLLYAGSSAVRPRSSIRSASH